MSKLYGDPTPTWINIAMGLNLETWLRVDLIEAVKEDAANRTIVYTVSGQHHTTTRSVKGILDAILGVEA